MKKRLLCFILFCSILFPIMTIGETSDTEHDLDLKEVFFGKNCNRADTEELVVLQWAAYFSVDCIASTQSSKTDLDGLNILKGYGVEGVPSDISAFHYTDNKFENSHHERYTHLGWNHSYGSGSLDYLGNISHWPDVRKPLLMNTVRQVFVKGKKDLWSTLDFIGLFHPSRTDINEKQVESMAAMIYYAHVLGDHCYNTQSTVFDRIPLARRTENDNNGSLIYDLKQHFNVIFSDQLHSSNYRTMIAEMDAVHSEIINLLGNNEFPSVEQFALFQNLANKLMDVLKKYIPKLLKEEIFFTTVFSE